MSIMWFVTIARSAALALGLAGQSRLGGMFDTIASLAESGANVEAKMALIKAKLDELHAAGQLLSDGDWDAVEASINAASDKLQGS
jgi:hypothetical protein